jgi:hypothetical protein
MLLRFEENRRAGRLQRILIAREQEVGDLFARGFNLRRLLGENDAGGEPDEIKSEWHRAGFVEITNSPHEPVPRIAPDGEVFDMQISHCEEHVFMSIVKVSTLLSPSLKPSIKRPAKKRKGTCSHPRMLDTQSPVLQIGLIRQPRLVE